VSAVSTELTKKQCRRLGLIVNPVAGLGGRVGLKGTDGSEIVRRALELGAEPVAPARARRALARLERHRDAIAIVAGARAMGGDAARGHGFETELVEVAEETSAEDTRAVATELERRQVDLILYAGGDGTTRDIVDAVGTRIPILGIPTGVKMHSGVFATSPEAAGDLAASRFELGEAEVMDIDEAALREGRVTARLYGVATVPRDRVRVQHPKAGSRPGDAALEALCRELARETEGLTLYGPGTTTRRILAHLGIEGTPLGIDAVEDGRPAGLDLGEAQLLELLAGRRARVVVSVVGGQGYVLGRGNQQLSPVVLRRAGVENLVIVASLAKLAALDPPRLLVDTGDVALDGELSGYRRVRVAPGQTVVFPLEAQ
jgi:predicted polyphosphate/ATP-dependent NAD kinase